jgi:hypothetical protein
LRQDSERRAWSWLNADHPAVLAAYGMWMGGTLGVLVGLSSRALTVGSAIACATTAVTVEATYRRQRWQRATVAEEITHQTNDVATKLAELSERRR